MHIFVGSDNGPIQISALRMMKQNPISLVTIGPPDIWPYTYKKAVNLLAVSADVRAKFYTDLESEAEQVYSEQSGVQWRIHSTQWKKITQ